MSLIFVLGNIGGALAAAALPASIGGGAAGAGATALGIGTGAGVGAGTASAVGTGAATVGSAALPAGATGAAALGAAPTGTVASGLFGGTSLAGMAGAPSGIAAGAGQIGAAGANIGAAGKTAAMASKLPMAGELAGSSMSGAVPASPGVGQTGGAVTGPISGAKGAPGVVGSGGGMSSAPVSGSGGPTSGLTTGSKTVDSLAVPAVLSGGQELYKGVQEGKAIEAQNKGYREVERGNEIALDNVRRAIAEDPTLGGGEGLGGDRKLARGGEINLQSGQFVIPADVISDLGNGDTKAGMAFLREFFETAGNA